MEYRLAIGDLCVSPYASAWWLQFYVPVYANGGGRGLTYVFQVRQLV